MVLDRKFITKKEEIKIHNQEYDKILLWEEEKFRKDRYVKIR